MFQLFTSLAHLEDLGITHRDIKQGNFLYNMNTRKGVLIDFGLSELVINSFIHMYLNNLISFFYVHKLETKLWL